MKRLQWKYMRWIVYLAIVAYTFHLHIEGERLQSDRREADQRHELEMQKLRRENEELRHQSTPAPRK